MSRMCGALALCPPTPGVVVTIMYKVEARITALGQLNSVTMPRTEV